MSNASFKMNGVEVFSENAQTVTLKNINVDPSDTTTPSMCKAWVNFNGTLAMTVGSSYGPDAPPADYSSPNPIRASYNVASITDNGTGDYTVNFATAMPDANYCAVGNSKEGSQGHIIQLVTLLAGSLQIKNYNAATSVPDTSIATVAIFR